MTADLRIGYNRTGRIGAMLFFSNTGMPRSLQGWMVEGCSIFAPK